MQASRYIWGVDLGEIRDPSAVAVVERAVVNNRWYYDLGALWQPGAEDVASFRRPGADFYEALQAWILHWQSPTFPRGARFPYLGNSTLFVDGTGPGRDAAYRFLRGRLAREMPMKPIVIRPGNVRGKQSDNGWYMTSRQDLVGTLDSVRDSGRLSMSLTQTPLMRPRIEAQLSKFAADERKEVDLKRSDHDDLAMALAIAVTLAEAWAGCGPGGMVSLRHE